MKHILHLLLSVFTLGLWIPVWILLALTGGEEQVRLSVDPKGQVHWSGPSGALFNPPAAFIQPVASAGAPVKTQSIKCFKCKHSQAVSENKTTWVYP